MSYHLTHSLGLTLNELLAFNQAHAQTQSQTHPYPLVADQTQSQRQLIFRLLELGLTMEHRLSLAPILGFRTRTFWVRDVPNVLHGQIVDYANQYGLTLKAAMDQLLLQGLARAGYLGGKYVQVVPQSLGLGVTPEQLQALTDKRLTGEVEQGRGRPKGAGTRVTLNLPAPIRERLSRYGRQRTNLVEQWFVDYLTERPSFQDISCWYSAAGDHPVGWAPMQLSFKDWQLELIREGISHFDSGTSLAFVQIVLALGKC